MKRVFVNLLLSFSKLFRLKRRLVFISFNGHYSDSPKCISEYIHKKDNALKIYWLVEKSRFRYVPDYYKRINIKSLKAYWLLMTSLVIVDNAYCKKGSMYSGASIKDVISLQKKLFRKKQLLFTTWHGTPYKKMGYDEINSEQIGFECSPMIMFHGNRHTMETMDRITDSKIRMLLTGSPRNDCLFHNNDTLIREKKNRLGLPIDKKIVLYAPTFRSSFDVNGLNVVSSGIQQINSLNFPLLFKTLKSKFGGDWVFVGRFHYLVEKEVDWNDLSNKTNNRVFNGNLGDDMSDYLSVADVLITDASSCMFDFLFSKKPCFIFFPDFYEYMNKERGFYFKPTDLPFSIALTQKDLNDYISSFSPDQFEEKTRKFLLQIGSVDDGNSTSRCGSLIIEEIRKHR